MIPLINSVTQVARVDSTIARALVEFALKRGISLASLVNDCGFLTEVLENRSRYISHWQMKQLWKAVLAISPEAQVLGLQFGNSFKVLKIGSLEVLAQKCDSLLDGLYKGCSFNFFAAFKFSFTDNDQEITLEFYPELPKNQNDLEVVVQSLSAFTVGLVQVLRVLSQKNIQPLQTYFPFAKPEVGAPYYADVLGGEVKFGQKCILLKFLKQDLAAPIIYRGGADTFHTKMRTSQGTLRPGPFSKVVLQTIENSFRKEVPVLETVASALHMTARSLQRKLNVEGISYSQLQEEVRRKLALEFMQNSFFSISEISDKLGYANISAFSRVFKKWTGITPSEFKQSISQ
ncbi:MAG: AraC family transcriptional regulator ligand-binding domain-containing protein [Rufibacter sp.]